MKQGDHWPQEWYPEECLLLRRNGTIIRFLVSHIDFDLTKNLTFNSGYVRNRWRGGYLHSLIAQRLFLAIPQKYEIDHIDRNRLNNTRQNLRLATYRGQMLNRAYKGYEQHGSRWRAYADILQGRIRLGTFDTKEEAQQCAHVFHAEILYKADSDGPYIYPKAG